ncbi:hypothetical protein B0H21DRAFT_755253, partial [Amylocystis lapponica]
CDNKFPPSTKFQLDGRNVTLLEIPSLDGARLGGGSDAEVVSNLAEYLSSKYKKGQNSISGVVYLHPMTENRLVGSDKRNYDLFQHLCGDEAFPNTMILTNKWHMVNKEVGIKLERELSSRAMFFKPALDGGSQLLRLDDAPAATRSDASDARKIVRKFFDRPPIPLLIQRELADKRLRLSRTIAGIKLLDHLASMEQRLLKDLQDVRQDMREEEQGSDDWNELEATEHRLNASLKKLEAERKKVGRKEWIL